MTASTRFVQRQVGGLFRDLAEGCDVDLSDPKVRDAVEVVASSLLGVGRGAEPDDRAVANGFVLGCQAWRDLVA